MNIFNFYFENYFVILKRHKKTINEEFKELYEMQKESTKD
ncbi:unnamed protein product [Acanthoscelides obtectus]|uniref:Uncharacterized protein n=1 Tax=Acanthoscelides obtectus TaxID=200917 RepID=A0A9P0KLM8_ACAOB|nr:unnamed protein product [Acanthoscelides obtectus]CAK1671635.1 hypothetical protein AOBTE_LOCUS28375 [Acanthoscelides obtectus]